MTLYEVLLLLHIVAAIIWVGGGIATNVLGARLMGAGDATAMAGFARQVGWMGTRVFAPASLAVLGLGIAMVAENDAWTIGQLWIVVALVGIGLSAITGASFFGPESKRISAAIEARGAQDPEVRRRLGRIISLGRLDLLLLLLIVADMVIKPGL
jgi:uncharacterized membrane protein